MLLNTTKIAAATTKNRRSANNMVNVGTQSIFETMHLEKKLNSICAARYLSCSLFPETGEKEYVCVCVCGKSYRPRFLPSLDDNSDKQSSFVNKIPG